MTITKIIFRYENNNTNNNIEKDDDKRPIMFINIFSVPLHNYRVRTFQPPSFRQITIANFDFDRPFLKESIICLLILIATIELHWR